MKLKIKVNSLDEKIMGKKLLTFFVLFSFQELQLHLGVLQQHAALIGGPNATSCPICHKLFLGADALMEHMKHSHKDPSSSSPPVAAAASAPTTASKNFEWILFDFTFS